MKPRQAEHSPETQGYSVAREIAERTVDQWDLRDSFRVCEKDKALWHGDSPDEVVLAREFLRLLGAVEQAVVNQFASHAANGVLEVAVRAYQE